MKYHSPVLVNEINQILAPFTSKTIIDATLGNGGHTINFLSQGATVFGIDKDQINLSITTNRIRKLSLEKNFTSILSDFTDLSLVSKKFINRPVDAILFDLGLSINQQKSTNRGFSFQDDLSLDMRLNQNQNTPTAKDIINSYSVQELFSIFSVLGQEVHSLLIAQSIVKKRQLKQFDTAKSLADFIVSIFKQNNLSIGKIHPATKIFLALKIAVNNELNNLTSALNQSLKIVKQSGWILVITFHSTEDRLVKNFIKSSKNQKIITNILKIKPDFKEIKQNPLSRSALLRAFQKV